MTKQPKRTRALADLGLDEDAQALVGGMTMERDEYAEFLRRLEDVVGQLGEMGARDMGLLKHKEAARFHRLSERLAAFLDGLDPDRYQGEQP